MKELHVPTQQPTTLSGLNTYLFKMFALGEFNYQQYMYIRNAIIKALYYES